MNVTDLRKINEIRLALQCNDATLDCRKACFLAACLCIDPTIGIDCAEKLRPYGGLIGVDNSRLDHYLNSSKILRLHAALHDAAGFAKEYSDTGPGYVYAVACPIRSCLAGHLTGILFCSYVKFRHKALFQSIEC